MSQDKPINKTAKPRAAEKGGNPRVRKNAKESAPVSSNQEQPKCHIHDKIIFWDDVNEIRKNVCFNDELPEEFEGRHYCLFHLPSKNKDKDKFEDKFKERLKAVEEEIAKAEKLSDEEQKQRKGEIKYDFRYVWFPTYLDFTNYKFTTFADFKSATFTEYADFYSATFMEYADFYSATFLTFADFSSASFLVFADFSSATFDEKSLVVFRQTKFSGILDFSSAVLKGYLAFEGKRGNRLFIDEKSRIDLQNARIDDAKRISFHTVRLESSWFINTDASEFVFTDCKWSYAKGGRLDVKKELENLKKRGFENPSALLTKTCWQLADNHEESKSFANASFFRQIAQESRRLEIPWFRQPLKLHWWYYAVSLYSERWTRAVFMLIGILFLFGLLYAAPFVKFDYGANPPKPAETLVGKACDRLRLSAKTEAMTICDGLVHSLGVASFQRPDPKPADVLTKLLVTLETILAPLQAALLALAIRRKFMR